MEMESFVSELHVLLYELEQCFCRCVTKNIASMNHLSMTESGRGLSVDNSQMRFCTYTLFQTEGRLLGCIYTVQPNRAGFSENSFARLGTSQAACRN